MMLPNLSEVDSCGAFGGDGGMGRNEVTALTQHVHDDHDGVESMGLGEVDDEIEGNGLPGFRWGLRRYELADRKAVSILGPHAQITRLGV
jgi:hypothetical protein